uniref:Uncharacterized protein n=1 Tax=Aegilops tauschii subsp. strangulata TaxID=200361 RepID=A0A453ED95_AEGTS
SRTYVRRPKLANNQCVLELEDSKRSSNFRRERRAMDSVCAAAVLLLVCTAGALVTHGETRRGCVPSARLLVLESRPVRCISLCVSLFCLMNLLSVDDDLMQLQESRPRNRRRAAGCGLTFVQRPTLSSINLAQTSCAMLNA